ncbi:hypothetical protein AAZV13_03G166400 [Glycine max]
MIYMLCFTSRKINYLSYINKLLLICIVVLLTTFLTVKCSLPHSSVTEINLPETSTSVYNITLNSFFNFKHPTTKYLLPSAPPNNTLSWPRPFILNLSNTILHQISTNITCQSEISKKNDDLATNRANHEPTGPNRHIQKTTHTKSISNDHQCTVLQLQSCSTSTQESSSSFI